MACEKYSAQDHTYPDHEYPLFLVCTPCCGDRTLCLQSFQSSAIGAKMCHLVPFLPVRAILSSLADAVLFVILQTEPIVMSY